MIVTAKNNIDYIITGEANGFRGLEWTLEGMKLTMLQRGMIEKAFMLGKLGESYTFPDDEMVWEFHPEVLDELDQDGEDDVTVDAEEAASREARSADRVHRENEDRRWSGLDYDRNRK